MVMEIERQEELHKRQESGLFLVLSSSEIVQFYSRGLERCRSWLRNHHIFCSVNHILFKGKCLTESFESFCCEG